MSDTPNYPQVVRVVYPVQWASRPGVDESEEGIAYEADAVTVGPYGDYMELHDVLLVDGVPREIVAIKRQMDTIPGGTHVPGVGSPVDFRVTLRHRATDRPFVKQMMPE